ncbi:MAG: tRNA (adenosine(37)-N6)-threonylcarbamoyltransferase complex transferase subunit TsaD [Desulfamplus sp.]|nr:tRNA (adenosine(37)-N6)-threonylcarbamoyltransferase complex transferase subunit TsaD [Desulfamplus sp.]
MIILGIESSCDETAAAVVEDGTVILSSVVSSQIAVHHKYGGVVPELASRMHIESIIPVVMDAVESAGITLDDIDGVAATRGPGLIGALLVGFSFAKAFAWARSIPWTGVNHLEGHIYSVLLSDDPPEFPFVILLASGGHTNLYSVTSADQFELMGQTRDDAAGEAFDKVAKMLGLGYPGGAVIEKLAQKGDPHSIAFPKSYLEQDSFDFSFSGVKSAVARYIHDLEDHSGNSSAVMDRNNTDSESRLAGDIDSERKTDSDTKNGNNHTHSHGSIDENTAADIAASFQEAVTEVLSHKLVGAALNKGVRNIAVAGGVAANSALRRKLLSCINAADPKGLKGVSKDLQEGTASRSVTSSVSQASGKKGSSITAGDLKLHMPPLSLCGDNAAMIAARGYTMIKDGRLCHLDHDVFSRTRI